MKQSDMDRAAMEAVLIAVQRARLKAVLHQSEAERLEDCWDADDDLDLFMEDAGGQE